MNVRPGEIRELSELIRSSGRVRVPLSDLWRMWDLSAPRLSGNPGQVAALRQALSDLRDEGIIELPSGAWDLSTSPPLPRSVLVPDARSAARKRPWITYPWCQQLGWVASLPTLSESRYEHLVSINNWLVRTAGSVVPVVPVRYRSVELLDDEKQLETMLKTNLFSEGRLSLEMLSCVRRPPPLAAIHVGSGPDVLVVENSDPYWVAVDVLRSASEHLVGRVVYGAGSQFPAQVSALTVDVADHGPVLGTVWYWGDLDPKGLAIAAEASRLSKLEDGPPILPAHQLWDAMAEHPGQTAGKFDWSNSEVGLGWLGKELTDRTERIRSVRARVAQENIGGQAVLRWANDLSCNEFPGLSAAVESGNHRGINGLWREPTR